MSQSIYLYVYFRSEIQKEEFKENLKKARDIFKEVWKVLGNGFDEKGNINGLEEYYSNCEWDSDAEDLSKEEGELIILHLSMPKKDEHFSFNFHHYGADTKLDNKTDLRDIYLIFAEILSACFGYVTCVSDEYDDERYSVFFDEDGKKYILCEDRADYIRAFKDLIEAERHLSINQEKLSNAKHLVELFKKNRFKELLGEMIPKIKISKWRRKNESWNNWIRCCWICGCKRIKKNGKQSFCQ